ncbi:cysteine--tRNA ligase [bacterium]|nr:cysteine--tRNA ligase [bacterium]|tara:strand:+ start:6747 stop:8201 length:1455 start_codon:yes stop_codon:yes gene_type:complete
MQIKPILFYNTLSKETETFKSLKEGEVRLYSCGPTVYDRGHIGNMRSYILSDIIRRTFEYNGYEVHQVINITDVGHLTGDNEGDADTGEDRMEKASVSLGESAQDIAKKYTTLFFTDIRRLNIDTEKIEFPRATEYINEQIAMVQTLQDIGYAYKVSDGVYYDTSMFKNYGKLGGINVDELEAGARVKVRKEKRNATDFALWKFSSPDQHRQQEWESPWGVGFPGWHIECSAMSRALLGRQIDIHTGGIDHIPVHHNNEIAQSEVVNKKKFVNYWLHNAFINVEGRRMGKSIGNLINLDQVIDRGFSPLSYRYWLLTAHYRTPANFTWDALEGSHAALKKLHRYFVDELNVTLGTVDSKYKEQFHAFINSDLDTPKAIALVWELMKDDSVSKKDKRATLLDFDTVLGLGLNESDESMVKLLHGGGQKLSVSDIPTNVKAIMDEREQAREQKDFRKADALREQLHVHGYEIEDTAVGPRLSKRKE